MRTITATTLFIYLFQYLISLLHRYSGRFVSYSYALFTLPIGSRRALSLLPPLLYASDHIFCSLPLCVDRILKLINSDPKKRQCVLKILLSTHKNKIFCCYKLHITEIYFLFIYLYFI
jgi:hypothetical protein